MIYIRFEKNSKVCYGILEGKTVFEITPNYFSKFRKTGKKFSLSAVKLLCPVVPSKVVALGLNYLSHIKELNMDMPLAPLIFLKPATSVAGPGDEIEYPAMAKRVDYEGELALVIKKKAKNVPIKNAGEYILGYTCLNDVTARDLQKYDGQWTRAKSFDTFCPIGPCIVDDIDANNLKIESWLNHKKVQSGTTRDMIFKLDEIVSFVSNVMTLLPGDVIATGTPPGIGQMKPGDKIKIRIEHIGELENKVVKLPIIS